MSIAEIRKNERKELYENETGNRCSPESEECVESIVIPYCRVHNAAPYIVCRSDGWVRERRKEMLK